MMEGFLMLSQLVTLLEGHPTVQTEVRSLFHVDALVGDEVCPTGEVFPTCAADKGLHLGVCFLVKDEVSSQFEALPTIPALEGLLTPVDP